MNTLNSPAAARVRTKALELACLAAKFRNFVDFLTLSGSDREIALQLIAEADVLLAEVTGLNQKEQVHGIEHGRARDREQASSNPAKRRYS